MILVGPGLLHFILNSRKGWSLTLRLPTKKRKGNILVKVRVLKRVYVCIEVIGNVSMQFSVKARSSVWARVIARNGMWARVIKRDGMWAKL